MTEQLLESGEPTDGEARSGPLSGVEESDAPPRSAPAPDDDMLISEDGLWYWDGQQWRLRSEPPPPPHSPDPPRPAAELEASPVQSQSGGGQGPASLQPSSGTDPTPPPTAQSPGGDLPAHPEQSGAGADEAVARPRFDPEHSFRNRTVGRRGLMSRLSGGLVGSGLRQRDLIRLQFREQVRTTIAHPPARIAIAGAKGGVGKTTVSLALAATMGRLRNSRIIAYETHHVGSYGSRLTLERERSLQDLLELIDHADSVLDIALPTVDLYTTQVPDDRYSVLTAPRDPAAAQLLGEAEHRRVLHLLYRYFDIVIADLDPALLHSGTAYWLGKVADQVVVVSPTAFSGARLADATLNYLEARLGQPWVRERVLIVVNAVRVESPDVREIERHFRQRVQRVHRIPWDPHLEKGGLFLWDEIGEPARDAYLSLSASIGSGFKMGPSPAAESASQDPATGPVIPS